MFERFTEASIKAIMLAQEESRRLGHNFVGTENFLLGLIGQRDGLAAQALKSQGVELANARVEVEKIVGLGSRPVAMEVPFTPRAKRVLELSWCASKALDHNYIGTEHLLLGLIHEGEGVNSEGTYSVASQVLQQLGVDFNSLKREVLGYLDVEESQYRLVVGKPREKISEQLVLSLCYTEDAKEALSLAGEEARRTGHNFIGTEQILLGIAKQGTGCGAFALDSMGAKLDDLRNEVLKIIGRGSGFVSEKIPLTPRAKRILMLGADESKKMSQELVGTGHLLLGLIIEGDGVAVRVLENMGIDVGVLQATVKDIMNNPNEET